MQINMKQAVKAAVIGVRELFEESTDWRLEEVKRRGLDYWSVVISFRVQPSNALGLMLGQDRLFKEVTVNAADGSIDSLTHWKP